MNLVEKKNFVEEDWERKEICDVHFRQCLFQLVNLSEARLQDVVFENCKLVGLKFHEIYKRFFSIECKDSILLSCNFSDLNMEQTNFEKSAVKESFFTDCQLKGANFSHTDLSGTLFHHCDLRQADFSAAKNYNIDLRSNEAKGARFSSPEALNLLACFEIEVD